MAAGVRRPGFSAIPDHPQPFNPLKELARSSLPLQRSPPFPRTVPSLIPVVWSRRELSRGGSVQRVQPEDKASPNEFAPMNSLSLFTGVLSGEQIICQRIALLVLRKIEGRPLDVAQRDDRIRGGGRESRKLETSRGEDIGGECEFVRNLFPRVLDSALSSLARGREIISRRNQERQLKSCQILASASHHGGALRFFALLFRYQDAFAS